MHEDPSLKLIAGMRDVAYENGVILIVSDFKLHRKGNSIFNKESV